MKTYTLQAYINTLAEQLSLTVQQTALGIIKLVDTQMSKALKMVTVERGIDLSHFTLVAFGGNGPLHACALAKELGISKISIPPSPGTFSAYGLLRAKLTVHHIRPILKTLERLSFAEIKQVFEPLQKACRQELIDQGVAANTIHYIQEYDARYRGQSFELSISNAETLEAIASKFHAAHQQRYGFSVKEESIELVNARVMAYSEKELSKKHAKTKHNSLPAKPCGEREVPVYQRQHLTEGQCIDGPAIIEQYDATTFVEKDWMAKSLQGLLQIRLKS